MTCFTVYLFRAIHAERGHFVDSHNFRNTNSLCQESNTTKTPTNMKILSLAASLAVFVLPVATRGIESIGETGLAALAKVTEFDAQGETVEEDQVFRQLQTFTPACNASYNQLWTNAALNTAYNTYSNAAKSALSSAASSNGAQCIQKGNDFTCNLTVPVSDITNFKSACTSAGGSVLQAPSNIDCAMSNNGKPSNSYFDLPSNLDCYPKNPSFAPCVQYLLNSFKVQGSFLQLSLEATYTNAGFTNVNCQVGNVKPPSSGAAVHAFWAVASLGMMGAYLLL